MAGRPWTERERRLLRELVRAGEDLASMTDELGRSWHGVRLKLAQLGGRKRYGASRRHCRCPLIRARLLDLLAAQPGLTLSAAGRTLGRSTTAVQSLAGHLVADGLLERTGGATRSVRYRPTRRWLGGRD